MRLVFSIFLLFFAFQFVSQTQSSIQKKCGTQIPNQEWNDWFNNKVATFQAKKSANALNFSSYTIPVIIHVIAGSEAIGTFPNLSANQLRSQITVLNRDFAGNGQNIINLAATEFSVVGAANCYITFCLAQFNESGLPLAEPGIDRINYSTKGWSNPTSFPNNNAFSNYMDGTIKPNSIWDVTKYLNIWISDVGGAVDLLGYATFPSGTGLQGLAPIGTAQTDGIWLWSRAFGNVGTLQSPYNLGRTATHEIGHWLGLRHIGGDGNGNPSGDCNATDYCNDTPPQKGGYANGSFGQNFGSPAYPLHVNACSGNPNGDMFMNFMDYTDDNKCIMFTPDQLIRMQTAMENSSFRNQLNQSSTQLCIGMPVTEFIVAEIACPHFNINLGYQGIDTSPSFTWTSNPTLGETFIPNNNTANATVNFPLPGIYTLSLVGSNSIGSSTTYTTITIDECVGLKKISNINLNISIFPNPNTGIFSLKTNFSLSENLEIQLFNSIGQQINNINFSKLNMFEINFNLENFEAGLYFLKIISEKGVLVKQIVKEN